MYVSIFFLTPHSLCGSKDMRHVYYMQYHETCARTEREREFERERDRVRDRHKEKEAGREREREREREPQRTPAKV